MIPAAAPWFRAARIPKSQSTWRTWAHKALQHIKRKAGGCKNVNILSEDKYLIFITTIVPELAKPISRFCTFETTLAGVIYETTDRVV